MLIFNQTWAVNQIDLNTFELQKEREIVRVLRSPKNNGTFYCERRFMALTFVIKNGQLVLKKKMKKSRGRI